MNAHTNLAQQIADEIGKPANAGFIERQLLAKSFPDKDDVTTEQLFAVNRAAIDRSLGYERARLSAVSLDRDEQIALAIHIIDHLNHVDCDARNHAVDVLGGLV